ncbi:Transcriptional regulatory protein sin3, partial [Coemansia sp. RSA 2618]
MAGSYARSPTFASTTTTAAAAASIKSPMQHGVSHSGSPSIAGAAALAATHDETAPGSVAPSSFASQSSTQAPMPRIHPPSMASPNARAAAHPQQAMQSPHQNAASAPLPKQAPSPRVNRAISAQSTPIPPHAQQSPRVGAAGAHASSAGAAAGSTFATTPKSSLSTGSAAVPPLGPTHNMGTVGRPAPATSGPSQSAGLAISGAQNGSSTSAAPSSTSAQAAAPAASESRQSAQADASGRPLNVSDALSYLDMVKSQFQDRPEVYNQFLEIMKEFKSHAIDTPGVIERVSRLFYGSPALIQGFNTFLPPGYRIECSDDPTEGVRVTTPSGSIIPDMHRRTSGAAVAQAANQAQSPQGGATPIAGQRSHYPQQQQQYASRDQYASRRAAPGGATASNGPPSSQMSQVSAAQAMVQPAVSGSMTSQAGGYANAASQGAASGPMGARSPGSMRSPSIGASQRSRHVPVEFNHAITYVNKIKMRFAGEPDRYKEFLEILQTYQKESRPIQDVYGQVQHLFSSAPDLLDEFKQFLPDIAEGGAANMVGLSSPGPAYARAGSAAAQAQMGDAMASGRLPPVGNFAPAGTPGHAADPYAAAQAAGMAYDGKGPGATPTSNRKRRGVMGGAQAPGAGSAKRRTKGGKTDSEMAAYGQGLPVAQVMQQAANPATATPDELAFFERVKRFIGQPNAYNEFLKLLNLYNQQVLDPKTLVERAESFIGDDQELFGWFKQFVGFDEQQHEMDDAR